MKVNTPSSPPLFPFPSSVIRVRVRVFSLSLSLLVLLLTTAAAPSAPSSYSISCNDVVPETTPAAARVDSYPNFRLSAAYFSGGDSFLGQTNPDLNSTSVRSASLQVQSVYKTDSDTTLYVSAVVYLWGSGFGGSLGNSTRRKLRQHGGKINFRGPRVARRRRNTAVFQLQGYWSESSHKLCMVGKGLNYLRSVDVVLMLDYPTVNTLDRSVVNGTLRYIDKDSSLNEHVSILGFSNVNYEYKYVDSEIEKGVFSVYDNTDNADRVSSFHGLCSLFRRRDRLQLEYTGDCGNVSCDPLGRGGKSLPKFMSLNEIGCYGKVRYLLDFSDLNFNGRNLPFDPNTTLVAEGAWNKNRHLDLVACRLLNITESITKASIGDCSIRLSLRFPATFSLKTRSSIIGLMWSNKTVNDLGYFGRIAFQSPTNGYARLEGLKYEYTMVDSANRTCSEKITAKRKRGKYPDGLSSDMRFNMVVSDRKGHKTWGYSSPLSVGDRFYQHRPMFALTREIPVITNYTSLSAITNVSYVLSFNLSPGFKLPGNESTSKIIQISAEGTYDPTTGVLCMLGCRNNIKLLGEKVSKNETLDCEILVNIQYSQLGSKDDSDVKGTIESNRQKSDPLYFDKLELKSTSISTKQARESIWRMDLEITIVLISNTLLCVFVITQLLYVKKYPDVLPFVSLVMMTFLTLAQMIPLVLNFEALFVSTRNRQNVFLGSGGWLEVNEVLVRVITMIAFLLEFRLLQQAWSSRIGDGNSSTLWASDKKVLFFSIPLYIGGVLIAWSIHHWKYTDKSSVFRLRAFNYKQQQTFWVDFKSYAGLILDGFLLPQIVFNVFCNTREKALAPAFYIGTTVVRLLPHVYDLYRGHWSKWYFSSIYADPGMDYYSVMWDITISCGGMVFILIIYLQQRFGGRCFLPKRFRESHVYEKVPVVSCELSQR